MSHGVCHFITQLVFAYSYDAVALFMSPSIKATGVSYVLCLSIWVASKLLEARELILYITVSSGLLTARAVGRPLLFRQVPVLYEAPCPVEAPVVAQPRPQLLRGTQTERCHRPRPRLEET